MTSEPASTFEFDVALSYAAEDRVYVQSVAEQLRDRGVRLFYDEFSIAELWGANLFDLFDDIFRKRARFAIIFVSHFYADKPWPRHERQSAQARALIESNPFILPVRLDDSELTGLPPTIGYVDARRITSDRLVDLVMAKLGRLPTTKASETPPMRVPRTQEQMRELLGQRPAGWEYLLFAGLLYQRKEALEPKWHDHELRYIRPTGPLLTETEALTLIESTMNDAQVYCSNIAPLFDPLTQDTAFGPKGYPGDSNRIEYLAQRLVGVYGDLLDLQGSLRGARCPQHFRRLFQLAADLIDQPISQLRDYFDYWVTQCDRIPDWTAHPAAAPTTIDLTLTLETTPGVSKEIERELERLGRPGSR